MSIATDILILCGSAVLIKFIFFVIQRRKDLNAFRRLGIPGPEPEFFAGNLWQLKRKDKLPFEVIDEWIVKYGNVFGYFIGERRHLIINDREILRNIFLQNASKFRNRPGPFIDAFPFIHSVLFTADEIWKRQRRVLQPLFSPHQVRSKAIHRTIVESAERMIQSMEKYGTKTDKGIAVPMHRRMQAFSLDVISRTAFNMEADVHDENNEVLKSVRDYFSEAMNVAVNSAAVFPILRPIMTLVNDYLTAGAMTDLAISHVKKQIAAASELKQSGEQATTFMNAILNCLVSGSLTETEVIANSHIILLAGYETTATTATFLVYHLAKYPEYQKRLREDLQNGDEEFFTMMWMESLRILPIVTSLVSRIASSDIEVDGITIEAGTIVEIPVWTIHHDPEVWPEPYKFDPFRFSKDNRDTLDPMSFLSFGVGGRYCLGSHLATAEAKAIVSALLDRFEVSLLSDEPMKLKWQAELVNPAEPVTLLFTPL